MALLGHAFPPDASLGKHCAIPQAYTVADLLTHGPHDEATQCPFRGCRALDWSS